MKQAASAFSMVCCGSSGRLALLVLHGWHTLHHLQFLGSGWGTS